MLKDFQRVIENAWESRESINIHSHDDEVRHTIECVLDKLERGEIRVAELIDNKWHVHTWIKQAVMLYFKLNDNQLIKTDLTQFYDKVPLQYQTLTAEEFRSKAIRVVPPACVRRGAYIAPQCVVMPAYVNIGAYIGQGTMIDTWATIGSCAQIGNHVHISGGVGIGGVLEPLQATPTIIEDNCFIGARSEIVEGVIVEQGAVISMGVFIGQSTRIYDRENDTISYGRIPKNAVVVPGTLPSSCGKYQLAAAIIVKRVDEKTRKKVGLNQLLRNIHHE